MDIAAGFMLCCLLTLAKAPSQIVADTVPVGHNLTEFLLHRQKRTLIYKDNGSLKFSIGPSMPVSLGDPVSWRSLVCSYTLQGGQYPLPRTPYYPWDKWEEDARTLNKIHGSIEKLSTNVDDSRLFVYILLESYMDRKHGETGAGRLCMLRSICDNAQVDHYEGLFAEILNIVLSPGNAALDLVYKEAYLAGKSGASCVSLYRKCPFGKSVFDQYLIEY